MLNEALAAAVRQNFMGLPITEATQKAQQLGMEVRVINEGTPTQLTNEFRHNRVFFTVREDRVISFRIG